MNDYFERSRNPYYAVVASLPLLIAYEVLITLTQTPYWRVRNAADVWIRQGLSLFNLTSHEMSFAVIFLLMGAIPFLHPRYGPLHWLDFVWMLLEAIFYSLLLGIIIQALLYGIFFAMPVWHGGFWQNIALSLGAGLFEEFVFRVILLTALIYLLRPLIRHQQTTVIVAIIVAALLFSLSHYVGDFADLFDPFSFLFRWFAGLLFTVLFFWRGFAIAAYTHAFYDIWVLV